MSLINLPKHNRDPKRLKTMIITLRWAFSKYYQYLDRNLKRKQKQGFPFSSRVAKTRWPVSKRNSMTKTILCQHPLNFGILSASSALRNSTGMVKTRSSSVPAELRKSTATITSKPPRCPQNFEIQLEQETHIWQKMLNQKNQNHTDTTLITSSNLVTVLRIVQPNFP